jgi:hypothetical protein
MNGRKNAAGFCFPAATSVCTVCSADHCQQLSVCGSEHRVSRDALRTIAPRDVSSNHTIWRKQDSKLSYCGRHGRAPKRAADSLTAFGNHLILSRGWGRSAFEVVIPSHLAGSFPLNASRCCSFTIIRIAFVTSECRL